MKHILKLIGTFAVIATMRVATAQAGQINLNADVLSLTNSILNGKLGINTLTPAFSLDAVANQAVGRFTTTTFTTGAAIELKNTLVNPQYLGVVNFNNQANGYPGQIAYQVGSPDVLNFKVSGIQSVQISRNGIVASNPSSNTAAVMGIHQASGAYGELGRESSVDGEFPSDFYYGVYGNDGGGGYLKYAGWFDGNVDVEGEEDVNGPLQAGSSGGFSTPQLLLTQENGGDLCRLRMGVAGSPTWDMVAFNGSNPDLRWYRSGSDRMILNTSGLTVNGTFVSSSDRNAKENIQPVSAQEILQKVTSLAVSRWNYKQDSTSEHIGPMAQDFYAAFKVGPDDKHITTIDEEGVALAAIQGLNQKLERTVKEKNEAIQDLKTRLEKLERLITAQNRDAK